MTNIKLFIIQEIQMITRKWFSVTTKLVGVMFPMLLMVQVLDYLGGVEILGRFLEPMMGILGLPGAMGIVWATALLGNLQSGLGVYIVLIPLHELTEAQITVLMSLLLIAHSIPVEQQIARRVGLRWGINIGIRCGLGFLYGVLLKGVYGWFELFQGPPLHNFSELLNAFTVDENTSILMRLWEIMKIMGAVSLLILIMVCLFRILEQLGILSIIERMLAKILTPLGIGKRFASIASIGLILGISYGGGFIMDEMKGIGADKLRDREIFLTMTLLGLVHGIVDDTLLLLVAGANLSGIFWGRIAFGIVVTILFKFIVFKINDKIFYQIFFVRRTVLRV